MKIEIEDKEFDLLLEYDQIKKRIRFLGIQLNVDYENRVPVFLGVLNGSFIFMADLSCLACLDFIACERQRKTYGSTYGSVMAPP